MKKRILLFTMIAGLGTLAISSYETGPAANGYDCTGAESAGTGSFANPTGCTVGSGCHSTSATSTISVAIELDSAGVATTHYKGGLVYTVKITGTNTGASLPKYGFQLNALKGTASTTSNANAGTWASTGLPANTHLTAPGSHTQLSCLEHSTPITLSGSSFTQSFSWTAPAAGTGTISFWGAANFVNGDNLDDAADLWNTNHVAISEWPATTAVGNVANEYSIKAYPNPVSTNLNIAMNNAQEGTYTLRAFDMSGKMVANETIEVGGANQTTNINTANWATGSYHVQLAKDGFTKTITVVKR